MEAWVTWLDDEGQQYEPVTRATVAHHGFLAVHPFLDGNGRTARLLLNLMLLRDSYPPVLLLQEWRLDYLEALAQADRGRYNPLLNILGRVVESGLDLYLDACAATPEEEWLPLAELATGTAHSSEYLALLIRKGRLAGTKHGGRWHSTRTALARYEAAVAAGVVPRGRPPLASIETDEAPLACPSPLARCLPCAAAAGVAAEPVWAPAAFLAEHGTQPLGRTPSIRAGGRVGLPERGLAQRAT
jgi:hypothetical protein